LSIKNSNLTPPVIANRRPNRLSVKLIHKQLSKLIL